jgi:thiamine pyrophosphate-dependent acetolactate synthase large subunit-like protein
LTDAVTGADLVIQFAEGLAGGVAYGLPGSSMAPLVHAAQSSDLRFVGAVHESTVIAMADGHCRLAGPTAALVYMLPGTANAVGNIYNAWRDESPIIVMATQQALERRRPDGSVGEANTAELVRPFTHFSWEVPSPEQLVPSLEAALRRAIGPPSGPAFLALPEDVLSAPGVAPPDSRSRAAAPAPASPATSELEHRLLQAERPLIVVGGQVRRHGGTPALERLARELFIPVAFEPFWNERLSISPAHEFAVGPLTDRSAFAAETDLVLAVGCRFFNEVHPRQQPLFPPAAFVAHANADPAKVQQFWPVDWASVCDPAALLETLATATAGRLEPERRASRAAWIADARARSTPRAGPFDAAVAAIAPALDHGFIVDESVSASQQLVRALGSEHGENYLATTGGSLGWATGAAAGVAIAGGRPVTCVLGDGAFFFGVQGLWPARALNLPITFVVLDNQGYGSTRFFEERYVATLTPEAPRAAYIGSDFRQFGLSPADVMRGFGIPATDVADAGQLRGELERRWTSGSEGPHGIVLRLPF